MQRFVGTLLADSAVTCEAYVYAGVLVPPYSVTCLEPGPPSFGVPVG